MYPEREFMKRFEAILAELDALSEGADDEALDDLNAELEDALLMLSETPADDAEELSEALEALAALAEDYQALAIEGVGEIAARLSMTAQMALGSARA